MRQPYDSVFYYNNIRFTGVRIDYNEDSIKSEYREYKDGLLSGKYIHYSYSGEMQLNGKYRYGNEIGKWYFRDNNGDTLLILDYGLGKTNISSIAFYEKSIVESSGKYSGNISITIEEIIETIDDFYFVKLDVDTVDSYSISYSIEGDKTGIWKYYYDNGQLSYKIKYKDGILVKSIKRFSRDGKRISFRANLIYL